MRSIIRRIEPWSAAKVGAFLGAFQGFLFGLVVVGIGAAANEFLAAMDQPEVALGWPAAFIFALLGGSFGAIAFAVGAFVYNVASRLGASFVADIDAADQTAPPASTATAQSTAKPEPGAPFLEGSLLDKE